MNGLIEFTAGLIALRRALAPLFDGRELHGRPADGEMHAGRDLVLPRTGTPMSEAEWNRATNRTLVAGAVRGGYPSSAGLPRRRR